MRARHTHCRISVHQCASVVPLPFRPSALLALLFLRALRGSTVLSSVIGCPSSVVCLLPSVLRRVSPRL